MQKQINKVIQKKVKKKSKNKDFNIKKKNIYKKTKYIYLKTINGKIEDRLVKSKRIKLIKKLLNSCFKNKIEIALSLKNLINKKVTIKLTQNNIFCSFINIKNNKTLHISSSGLYKIKISKRKLKHIYIIFLTTFFNKLQKYCKNFNNTIFKIVSPLKLRKKICFFISKQIKKKKNFKSLKKKYNIIVKIISKKCFNGCVPAKKLRKKRRFNRIFK